MNISISICFLLIVFNSLSIEPLKWSECFEDHCGSQIDDFDKDYPACYNVVQLCFGKCLNNASCLSQCGAEKGNTYAY